MPLRILEHAVAIVVFPAQARQQFLCPVDVIVVVDDVGVVPHFVGLGRERKIFRALSKEHRRNHGVAIDRLGDGAPEDGILEPRVFHRIDKRLADLFAGCRLLNLVEVKPQKIRVDVGSQVVQREVAFLLMVLIPPIILGLGIVQRVQLTGSEFQIQRVLIRHSQKNQLTQIRQPMVLLIDAAPVRIAAKHSLLARHILREPPRPARHKLVRRRVDVVGRSETSVLEGRLQNVLRHDVQRANRFQEGRHGNGCFDQHGVGIR